MKKIKILLLISLSFLSITSCSVFKENFRHSSARNKKAGIVQVPQFVSNGDTTTKPGTFLWAHYDATKRGSVMFVDAKGKIRILAENPPDAAIQSITEITGKVGEIEGVGSIEAAFKAQRSIAELGKRTAAVNMMRDALYRINEIYYASKDEKEEAEQKRKSLIDRFIYYALTSDKSPKIKINEFSDFIQKNFPKTNPEQEIKTLFEKVMDSAKDIAIKEAEASIEIAKSESNSTIENAKAQAESSKKTQKQIDASLEVYKDLSDNLTKKEKKEYLDKFLNL